MNFYKEIVKNTLTEEKKAEVKTDVVAYYFVRPIANLLTYPCIKLKMSATTVTKISAISVILMYLTFILGNTKYLYLLAIFFLYVWNVLDGVDGNIARYTNTCSANGGLWDATAGWLAMYFFFSSMGIVAFREESLITINWIPKYFYIIIGAFSGFCLIFPRLVMHKKAGLYSQEEIKKDKDRKNYGILKKIIFNLTSINGLATLFFIIALFTNTCNICMLVYLLLNGIIGIGMTLKLLYK